MRNLKISFIVIVLLTFFIHVEKMEAASGQTYEVGANILHVREDPASDATIIGLLHKGDRLTVFQEQYGWVQTYYGGSTAWVAKHHLIQASPEVPAANSEQTATPAKTTEAAANSVTVTAPSVNIRSGPTLEYAVIAGASQGETFNTISKSGDWINVELNNGNTGWIASWLTSSSGASTASSSEQATETATTQVASVNTDKEPTSANRSLSGFNIVLDAGHGGRDPGAIGLGGVYEKELVHQTTNQIAQTLRNHGATVIETRTSDYYLSLDERADLSNAYNTDAFISIHYNSFPVVSVQGFNTFYYTEAGHQLGRHVHSSISSAVPLANRGLGQAGYKVLRNTNAPAILLELGFITSPYDLSVIQTADYQQTVADKIAKGLLNYFH
ncbi:N-acetylmuramoyl-L-alanine amidase [Oceanobacillus alkalisoli]|uniref:N-acetylmuramoyl-L-alanine amidase n=1 Tax=Oceanobacillus alkalisoli TaxID=2925113 RepID=UPI001EE42DBE|nr:N-acetylmuramoyl-L-alanine amidase [Oceanobacillus alkalisoli]MCG5102801.1 N-acetylmuramoyl-L-alanine amidase [Oceanobacillus alkalisoli]